MAKKRKPKPQSSLPEATHVNMDLRLPAPVFRFCGEVAKLADTSLNTVINVMLATEVLKRVADNGSEKP